jgi:hypothetical protein
MRPAGLLGQALGLAAFVGGFLLMGRGVVDSNFALGIVGALLIPAGMWIMVSNRRGR